MEIETKRFLLRDFNADDVDAFARSQSGSRFLEYYADEVKAPAYAESLVIRFREWANEEPRLNFQFALLLKSTATLIGTAGLRQQGKPSGKGEIGIAMAEEYWGNFGYALEVMSALADFGFRTLRLNALCGSTVSGNSRIGRLLDAAGAHSTATATPEWMLAKGWQQMEWQIGADEWRSSRLAARWTSPACN